MQAHFTSFNISDVVKGGSLGHGTAVPGHYDIDLIIYSRGMPAFYAIIIYNASFKFLLQMFKLMRYLGEMGLKDGLML